MVGSLHLLRERRFLPFFITQFLGALNDNALKSAMVILITFQGSAMSGIKPEFMVNASAGVFVLPFFLFSATAGQVADKFEKSRVIRLIKQLEIAVMLIAGAGFALPSLPLLFIALFLMGAHSAMFGPIKYSILPQHLATNELVGGNALVASATFLAILLGTMLGGVLIGLGDNGRYFAFFACLTIAVLGYLASLGIPAASAAAPDLRITPNPFAEIAKSLRLARANRDVLTALVSISWFWFYGVMFLSQIPAFAKHHLDGSEFTVTLLLALFSVGVGAGSMLCARLSQGKIERKFTLAGAVGLTLFAADLGFAAPGGLRMFADIVLIGASGGLYCVPLYALIQARSEEAHRARVIAANNILNALLMVAASLFAVLLLNFGSTVPQLFIITAAMNAGVALWLFGRKTPC
jgi:MFS family permease